MRVATEETETLTQTEEEIARLLAEALISDLEIPGENNG